MNSGFTGIRLIPYLRAQYESLKEPNGLILQLPRPGPMASCPPGHARPPMCERTGAGRRMLAGTGASGPAAEGSAREC